MVCASSRTFDDFSQRAVSIIKYMFWHGARTQQWSRLPSLSSEADEWQCKQNNWGKPSPMLSLRWTQERTQLDALVASVNSSRADQLKCHISLFNSSSAFVLSGDPATLCAVQMQLDANVAASFFPVSVPFHCPILQPAAAAIMEDVKRLRITLQASDLGAAVWSTADMTNLQMSVHLMQSLIDMQCLAPVRWDATCASITTSGSASSSNSSITHVISFGPGGTQGVINLTHDNIQGSLVQVIPIGPQFFGQDSEYGVAKLDRKRLPAPAFLPSASAAVAPRTDLEARLAYVFRRIRAEFESACRCV